MAPASAAARRAALMAMGTTMAKAEEGEGEQTASHRPATGSVRTCMTYRDELLRHRVVTPDGRDFAVATHMRPAGGYITGAYPVQQGYLVMVRQPLYEVRNDERESALTEHEQLVQVLAETGIGVVR